MTYFAGFRTGVLRVTANGMIYFIVGASPAGSLGHAEVVICAKPLSGPRIVRLAPLDMFYNSREIA